MGRPVRGGTPEDLGGQGPEGAERVAGPLPGEQFLGERGDVERAGGDLPELLAGGEWGALHGAVELGRAGGQQEQFETARAASFFRGGELAAPWTSRARPGEARLMG
jgi:hypothetical protein